MISIVNQHHRYEKELSLVKYPDGTKKINIDDFPSLDGDQLINIVWKFDSEDELVTLIYVAEALKANHLLGSLYMPYVPNARMDRVKDYAEVFTLKYFAKVINWIGFKDVIILDPHSNVTPSFD